MSTASARALRTLALSTALLLGLGGCAATSAPAKHSTLQFRPVIATVSDPGSAPLSEEELAMLDELDCAVPEAPPATAGVEPVAACGDDGEGYLLGPTELDSVDVASATASPMSDGTTQDWGVMVSLDADDTARLADLTARLVAQPAGDPRNRLALVLGGRVISAPSVQAAITGGQVLIMGRFTEESAKRLAASLGG